MLLGAARPLCKGGRLASWVYIEQGNCRMTFEATPEPFIQYTKERKKKLTPHEHLKKHCF